ncbi:MAG: LysR substrate-binding domain-containing protein [Candidatus Methylomirabilales bacterium]
MGIPPRRRGFRSESNEEGWSLDLRQLETFVAVARHLSLTTAARDVHLTQPGVSRQVQSLENELGVALFARRGREGIELTAAGERFLAYAKDVLGDHRQLMQDLREGPGGLAGELRIAASTTPGEFLVPWFVAGFAAQYPQVHPQVVIANSMGVVAELRGRRCDLAFTGARLPGKDLTFDPIAEDEVVLAVPQEHPFSTRGEIQLGELEGQPLLEREAGSGTRLTVQAALAERGLALPGRVVMVLGNAQAIVLAVQSRHGVGFVSSLALQDRSPDRVVAIRLAGMALRRWLYMVTEKTRPLPRPASAFVAWVRELTNGRPGPVQGIG